MTTLNKTFFSKDIPNKRINIAREFNAPIDKVWEFWTDSALLDLWWAPQPWKANTKTMNFRVGGHWIYCMCGPDNEQSWGREDFLAIEKEKSFTAVDSFCDEEGNINPNLPSITWKNNFEEFNNGTLLKIELTFSEQSDIEKITNMGFEGGFSSGLNNLDELLLHN